LLFRPRSDEPKMVTLTVLAALVLFATLRLPRPLVTPREGQPVDAA